MSDDTRLKCPVEQCEHTLATEGPLPVQGGDPLHILIEGAVYRCEQHGLFKYHGDKLLPHTGGDHHS
jgi:hypothetical protein